MKGYMSSRVNITNSCSKFLWVPYFFHTFMLLQNFLCLHHRESTLDLGAGPPPSSLQALHSTDIVS